jgi:hypothetical protein
VTPAQLAAVAHPCLLAGETTHPRFRHRITDAWSLVLTINTGYE